MMDLALRPEFSRELIRRIAEFFFAYHQRCYEAAGKAMQSPVHRRLSAAKRGCSSAGA
jgi:hypothetical protein